MKHPKQLFRKALSLLLTAAVLAGVPAPAALASPAGGDTGRASQDGDAGGFAFQSTQEIFPEDCGKAYVTVTRTGDLSGAAEVTLNAYDMSASYGEDYILLDGEAPVEKMEGSRSVFDAFREDGLLLDKQETDMAMLEGLVEMQETGLSPEELMAEHGVPVDSEDEEAAESSAPALELLDQIGARAASLTLRFAPWQDSATVELEILEDETPEYSESFMLGLTGGEVAEGGAVFSGSIRDNEEDAPMALVSFDSAEATEDAAGTAQVWLSRQGDLATMSSVLISRDGAPYGYIGFNPYQEQQMVELPRGAYTLSDASGCSLGEVICVTVEANPVATALNAAGFTQAAVDLAKSTPHVVPADPELDTVPVYSEVPPEVSGADGTMPLSDENGGIMVGGSSSTVTGVPADWQMEWAKNGSYEDENTIVTAPRISEKNGTISGFLFEKDEKNSSGKYQNFKVITKDNTVSLDTHGGESAMRKSTVTANVRPNWIRSTGIESYTINYRVNGLSRDMKLSSWYYTATSGDIKIHGSRGSSELTVPYNSITSGADFNMVEDGYHSYYVYVQNRDPSDFDDGCELLLANAVKQTKRKYLFNITGSNELQFTDGKDSVILNEADSKMIKTMWRDVSQDKSNLSHVPLRFTYKGDHVMKLTGYQLVNPKSNQKSYIYKLNGSDYFVFDDVFLESGENEKNFCYAGQYNGKAYSAFNVQLIVEKEAVSYSMEESALGGLELTNAEGGKLYKGDDAVFKAGGGTEGASFSGVFVRAKTLSNNEWKTWTVHADSDHLVRVHLDRHYDEYVFQPVYSASADVLTVNYADGAQNRGKLVIKEGQAVAKDEYVKNDYVALAAQANAGYVTQWTSNGRVFYGDVFHYQLDGNPDNNAITVDFVKADLTTETITGSLSVTDANLYLSSLSGSKPLANTEWSVVSMDEYKGYTDAQGRYTIENFRGVKGGTYSMLVMTGLVPSYRHFTLGDRNSYSSRLPQFGPGIFYPESVRVRLDNSGEDSNLVELRPENSVEITVEVFNQEHSPYDISKVELKMMGVDSKKQNYLVDTVQASLDSSLTHASGGGNYTYYTAKVQAQNLPQDTRLYVNVVANMESTGGTMEVQTGDVNSGYEFIAQINDTSIPIQDDVPIIPGATAAADVSLKDLDIPFIGALDFSVGANNGAFFVRAADPNDPSIYTLTAGYSIIPTFGVTNPSDRYDQTKKNAEQLRNMSTKGLNPLGDTSDATTNVATDTSNATATEAGQDKKNNAKGSFTTPKLYIQPAVFLKFSMKTYVNQAGKTVTDLIGYDAVIGVDTRIVVNVTANIYGVPCYICVSIANETYVETQGKLATGEGAVHSDGDKTEIIYSDNRGELTNWDVCLQVPTLTATVKGGVGFNNFSSFYLQGKFSFKLGVVVGTDLDSDDPKKVGINAGGSLSFGFGGGMDILVFSPNLMLSSPEIGFGSAKIRDNIFPVTSGKPGTLSAANEDGIAVESMEDAMDRLPTQQDLLDALSDATFTPVERKNPGMLMKAGTISSQVLMDNAFTGTKVKLTQLDGGKIMATMLADNGAREGSYNFLSAAYAISEDEGKTWNSVEKISESGSLQFDTNIFELEDKLLVTWSEGDIDAVLEKKSVEELNAADMAAALNAMDLKGRFFDKTSGSPIGETFTIGENPGVACSMLEAVESDGKIYCYYERCQFPTSGEVTLETIAQRERTIACAVKEGDQLTTRQVRAQSQDSKEDYRIMEVVPFSHKGIVGEAVVIDLDGKLALHDAGSSQWTASNTDRQIFLRFYAPTGEPVTTALVPVTNPGSCAQHVEVVSNGDQLYMLWNQDGEIVYLNEFAVPASEKDSPQAAGVLAIVDTATGEVTLPEHEDDEEGYGFGPVAQHSTIHLDRAFDASISSGGDVLVSWVADEEPEDKEEMKEYLTEEVFGVVLKTVEEDGLCHLEAVGTPVAITDEESALGSVDGVCLSDDSFLIAYAKLNADTRMDSDSAQVKAVRSVYEPDLRIQSVSAPTYPLPGSGMEVEVAVGNYGLQPLNGVQVQVTGIGEGGSAASGEALMPGASQTIIVPVAVPEDFNATTKLDVTVTGGHTAYTDAAQVEVLYGPYFVPDGMAKLDSIPDTSSYVARLTVRNIGNAPGTPEIKYSSYIPGMAENSGKLEQTFRPEQVIEPQGSAMVSSKINETPVTDDQTIRVQVSLGEGYDQSAESYAPPQRTSNPQEPSDPQEKHHPFVDVPDTAWYAKAVQRVYTLGLMVGTDLTHFSPNMKTSRAMLAQVLYRMEGSPKVEKSVAYHDVPDNAWYADAVQWATRQGLFTGYGGGRFGPNDPATREQTAAVLYRYAKWKGFAGRTSGLSVESFIDYKDISPWAKNALAWAVENGVINGKSGGVLDPKGTSIRAELAQQLSRMF